MSSLTVGEITSMASAILVGIGVFVTYRMWRNNIVTQSEKDGEWKERVTTILGNLKEQVAHPNKKFSNLEEHFSDFQNTISAHLRTPPYKSKSPVVLTEWGDALAKEISAQEWIDKVSGSLKEKVKGLDARGIQDFCFEYVESTDQYSDEEQ